jgi:hypothetical protein
VSAIRKNTLTLAQLAPALESAVHVAERDNVKRKMSQSLNKQMLHELNHNYLTRSLFVKRALEPHQEWLEGRLQLKLADAIIFETDLALYNAALPRLLEYSDPYAETTTVMARLAEQLLSVEVPPMFSSHIELTRERAVHASLRHARRSAEESCAYSMNLVGCPVLLKVRDLPVPFVALNVKYHSGPNSDCECEQDIVVLSRAGVSTFVSFLKSLTAPDGKARLKVGYEDTQVIGKCSWDQLVLDPTIISLLKDDFEAFFQREEWFRQMRLPYRRGYLLHGPPGNGKTSAIKAALNSQGLTAHTLRLFDEHVDDNDLDRVFKRAAQDGPSVILLEDIDRAFPRSGVSKTKVSLQQLLNCLDGVASGEGVITIATGNAPTELDAAILRRPGRFDRVILFPNPSPELRRQYFIQMHASFAQADLDEVVEESAGFSFALLREAFIMAAQSDFSGERPIDISSLLNSVWSLRGSLLFGSMKASAGFAESSSPRRRRS